MAANIETLEKLERKMTLTLPADSIRSEVEARLRKLARTVRMDGFRPGKVPLNIVAQRYGYSVQYEVVNDKVGEAFFKEAADAKLRVAGQPTITEKSDAPEGQLVFDAVFEVFPEINLGDLSSVEVEKLSAEVSEDAIDRTIDILRKQRCTFAQRAKGSPAEEGDRVTIDFSGKLDGEPFEGGKADDFVFILGEGQMLKEFEDAVRGMKTGESKTFPLSFPENYHGKEVAGKTADFLVTLKNIEAAHLPELNEAFIKSLGVADPTIEGLRADVRKNLEREVKFRVAARNKQAALDAVTAKTEFDVPKASVQAEVVRMSENARADLKARGIKDADKVDLPEDLFRSNAERRVRLGLVLAELVNAHKLQATPEQIKAQVKELAASYERPAEVERWYFQDANRLSNVEAMVLEANVADYVFSHAKVTEKTLSFDELMSAAAAPAAA